MLIGWFFLSFIVVVAFLLIHIILTSKVINKPTVDSSSYECGYFPKQQERLPFNLQFYVIGLLFIVFDIEIGLCLPYCLVNGFVGFIGFYIIFGFIILLGGCFILEWNNELLNLRSGLMSEINGLPDKKK